MKVITLSALLITVLPLLVNGQNVGISDKEMKRGTGKFETVRAAVYTTNTIALSLSKMYEKLNVDSNTKFMTFKSERAAVSWLVDL